MAVLWDKSRTYQRDDSGDPVNGALAYFYDHGTTTPMVVYRDASFSVPTDHPVPADGFGKWPAVFLPEGATYRLRITTSTGGTIDDDDGISVPTTAPPDFPDSETPAKDLFQTGDIKMRWAVSAQTGWVRLNGRTIGDASSGAAERANADCEDLFVFLWENDSNLSVSGGRGSTSAGDWAASKTIALPDWRGRIPAGLDTFGNAAAGRITDAVLGSDSDALGSAGGVETVTLTDDQVPAHDHGGSTGSDGGHTHFISNAVGGNQGNADLSSTNTLISNVGLSGQDDYSYRLKGSSDVATVGKTTTEADHSHTISSVGGGDPHTNLQPTIIVPFFIKL